MVTLRFKAEKFDNETIIFPTIIAVTDNKKTKFCLGLTWLKYALLISFSKSNNYKMAKAHV